MRGERSPERRESDEEGKAGREDERERGREGGREGGRV